MHFNAAHTAWAEETWKKVEAKLSAEVDRLGDLIPYIPKDGKYEDRGTPATLSSWTNGFWAGTLWQAYNATGDEKYKNTAQAIEERMDEALRIGIKMSHDLGFLWMHLGAADYKLTGSEIAQTRTLHAANLLAGRYNPDGHFICAWNGMDRPGWVIIDCMMNLTLLYWAYEQTGDPRYKQVAMHHADKCLTDVLRPDGSSYHIVAFNTNTGETEWYPDCQGYGPESAWSRGHAWAIYGYALSYKHTGEKRYLDAAKAVAHYFLANVAQTGNVPLVDFRAPAEPVMYDSTAAMCAACGMMEIAEHVPEFEKALYMNGAAEMVKATAEMFCNWNVEEDGILGGGTVAYHRGPEEIHVPIIYGDYFMVEALLRMQEKDFFIW